MKAWRLNEQLDLEPFPIQGIGHRNDDCHQAIQIFCKNATVAGQWKCGSCGTVTYFELIDNALCVVQPMSLRIMQEQLAKTPPPSRECPQPENPVFGMYGLNTTWWWGNDTMS